MTLTEECNYLIELGYYLFLTNTDQHKIVNEQLPYWDQDREIEMGYF